MKFVFRMFGFIVLLFVRLSCFKIPQQYRKNTDIICLTRETRCIGALFDSIWFWFIITIIDIFGFEISFNPVISYTRRIRPKKRDGFELRDARGNMVYRCESGMWVYSFYCAIFDGCGVYPQWFELIAFSSV